MLTAPGRCSSSYSSAGRTSTSCAPASRSSRSRSISIRLDMRDHDLAASRRLHHYTAKDASLGFAGRCELDPFQDLAKHDLHLERRERCADATPDAASERDPRVRRWRAVEPALGPELQSVVVVPRVAWDESDGR